MFLKAHLSIGWHLAAALTMFLITSREDTHERGFGELLQQMARTWWKCVWRERARLVEVFASWKCPNSRHWPRVFFSEAWSYGVVWHLLGIQVGEAWFLFFDSAGTFVKESNRKHNRFLISWDIVKGNNLLERQEERIQISLNLC